MEFKALYAAGALSIAGGLALFEQIKIPYAFDATPGNAIALLVIGVCVVGGTALIQRHARRHQ